MSFTGIIYSTLMLSESRFQVFDRDFIASKCNLCAHSIGCIRQNEQLIDSKLFQCSTRFARKTWLKFQVHILLIPRCYLNQISIFFSLSQLRYSIQYQTSVSVSKSWHLEMSKNLFEHKWSWTRFYLLLLFFMPLKDLNRKQINFCFGHVCSDVLSSSLTALLQSPVLNNTACLTLLIEYSREKFFGGRNRMLSSTFQKNLSKKLVIQAKPLTSKTFPERLSVLQTSYKRRMTIV